MAHPSSLPCTAGQWLPWPARAEAPQGARRRRAQLRERFGFACDCERCGPVPPPAPQPGAAAAPAPARAGAPAAGGAAPASGQPGARDGAPGACGPAALEADWFLTAVGPGSWGALPWGGGGPRGRPFAAPVPEELAGGGAAAGAWSAAGARGAGAEAALKRAVAAGAAALLEREDAEAACARLEAGLLQARLRPRSRTACGARQDALGCIACLWTVRSPHCAHRYGASNVRVWRPPVQPCQTRNRPLPSCQSPVTGVGQARGRELPRHRDAHMRCPPACVPASRARRPERVAHTRCGWAAAGAARRRAPVPPPLPGPVRLPGERGARGVPARRRRRARRALGRVRAPAARGRRRVAAGRGCGRAWRPAVARWAARSDARPGSAVAAGLGQLGRARRPDARDRSPR